MKLWLPYISTMVFFALIFAAIGFVFWGSIETPIETYTIEAEITHCDYSRSKGGYESYILSIVDGDFATTIKVTSSQYAKYQEGDLATVEITTYENNFGETRQSVKLID